MAREWQRRLKPHSLSVYAAPSQEFSLPVRSPLAAWVFYWWSENHQRTLFFLAASFVKGLLVNRLPCHFRIDVVVVFNYQWHLFTVVKADHLTNSGVLRPFFFIFERLQGHRDGILGVAVAIENVH